MAAEKHDGRNMWGESVLESQSSGGNCCHVDRPHVFGCGLKKTVGSLFGKQSGFVPLKHF